MKWKGAACSVPYSLRALIFIPIHSSICNLTSMSCDLIIYVINVYMNLPLPPRLAAAGLRVPLEPAGPHREVRRRVSTIANHLQPAFHSVNLITKGSAHSHPLLGLLMPTTKHAYAAPQERFYDLVHKILLLTGTPGRAATSPAARPAPTSFSSGACGASSSWARCSRV